MGKYVLKCKISVPYDSTTDESGKSSATLTSILESPIFNFENDIRKGDKLHFLHSKDMHYRSLDIEEVAHRILDGYTILQTSVYYDHEQRDVGFAKKKLEEVVDQYSVIRDLNNWRANPSLQNPSSKGRFGNLSTSVNGRN